MSKEIERYQFTDDKELEAIKFMIDEIDLVLASNSKYRARFDLIFEQFGRTGTLPRKYKTMLIKIYEMVTDIDYGKFDN